MSTVDRSEAFVEQLRLRVVEADNDVVLLEQFAGALRELCREYPWAEMSEHTGEALDVLITQAPSEAAARAATAHRLLRNVTHVGHDETAAHGR